MSQKIETIEDAIALMKSISAPPRLVQHHRLVAEAALELVKQLNNIFPEFEFNSPLVLIGAALHDVGKIQHQNEINEPGNQHENDGEKLLLSLGVLPEIARFCRTHAQWQFASATTEDLLVALADNLWKGCRKKELEVKVIEAIAKQTGKDFWDIFINADSLFETIADRGQERLSRSF